MLLTPPWSWLFKKYYIIIKCSERGDCNGQQRIYIILRYVMLNHPEVDYFPVTESPEVFYSSYATAIFQQLLLIIFYTLKKRHTFCPVT